MTGPLTLDCIYKISINVFCLYTLLYAIINLKKKNHHGEVSGIYWWLFEGHGLAGILVQHGQSLQRQLVHMQPFILHLLIKSLG